MSWLVLSLLAPFFWAITNFIDKYILDRHITSIFDFIFFSSLTSFLFVPIFILYFGYPNFNIFSVVVFVVGIIQVYSYGLYAKGLEKGETSSLMMLVGLCPVLTILIAWVVLGQALKPMEMLSSLIVIAGVFFVLVHDISNVGFRDLLKPGSGWMFAAVVIWSINLVIVDWLLQKMDFGSFMVIDIFGMACASLFLFLFSSSRQAVFYAIQRSRPSKYIWFIINTTLDTAAQLCLKLALLFAPLAGLVVVAMQIQNFYLIAIGFILTVFFPHIISEDISKQVLFRKIAGSIIMILGIVMLEIA